MGPYADREGERLTWGPDVTPRKFHGDPIRLGVEGGGGLQASWMTGPAT